MSELRGTIMEDMAECWSMYTLVDITKTGVVRGNSKERNQQRNYETVIQCVGMLAQPWEFASPDVISSADLESFVTNFGSIHTFTNELVCKLNLWHWVFYVERPDVLGKQGELLLNALNNVPIITKLDENAVIDPPVFSVKGDNTNVIVYRTL